MCSQNVSRILTKRLLFLSLVAPEVSRFSEVFLLNGVAISEGDVTPEPTDELIDETHRMGSVGGAIDKTIRAEALLHKQLRRVQTNLLILPFSGRQTTLVWPCSL